MEPSIKRYLPCPLLQTLPHVWFVDITQSVEKHLSLYSYLVFLIMSAMEGFVQGLSDMCSESMTLSFPDLMLYHQIKIPHLRSWKLLSDGWHMMELATVNTSRAFPIATIPLSLGGSSIYRFSCVSINFVYYFFCENMEIKSISLSLSPLENSKYSIIMSKSVYKL